MLQPRLQQRIDRKKEQLDALRPLPTAAVQRLQEELMVEWIYNSNAIEGNTLTLQETRLILETGLTIGGKSLREHFEVTNHRNAIEYVKALVTEQTPLTPFHVRRSLTLYLDACTPRTKPPAVLDQWIPLREAAVDSPYSQEYLSLLARTGRIEAVKRGRNWYTSKRALEEYRRSIAI